MGYGGGYATGYTDIPPTPETLRRWNGTTWVDLAYLTEAAGDDRYALLSHGHGATVADHEAAADPHPLYLTQAEGDARYPLAGHGHPASGVTAGTFGAGDYVFPAALTVNAGARLRGNGQSRLYLAPTNQVLEIGRYLDFHESGIADEATPDYDWRIDCHTDDKLKIFFRLDPWGRAHVGNVGIGAYGWDSNWAAFGHRDRMDIDSGSYAFMHHSSGDTLINSKGTTQRIRLNISGVDKVTLTDTLLTSTPDLIANNGRVGYWVNANHASFGHKDAISNSGNPFGFMMRNDGYCWIGATTQAAFRISGTDRLIVYTDNVLASGVPMRVEKTGGAWWYQQQFRAENPGTDHAGLGALVNGSGVSVKFYAHGSRGVRWVCANGDDSAHCPIAASAFEVNSTERVKKNITPINRPGTVKNLRPVRYQRINPIAVDPRNGEFLDTPTNRRNEEAFFGFTAEDVAAYAPEAVVWEQTDPDDPHSAPRPAGLDVIAMVALVAQALKDVDARLSIVEKRGP